MQQIHQNRADMHQKRHGHGQCFQYLPDIKTLAVFDGGGHTVSAAQTDECVAYIENAGNHDTGSTQKTLGKGNDENADVIAGMVQNIKGLLLFIGMAADEPACCHIEDTTAQTQKGENQKVRRECAGGSIDNQRGRKCHPNDNFGQDRKI